MQARRLDFSLDAARRSLAHAERTTPVGHPRRIAQMTNAGAILHWKGDYLAARELKLAVLRELERVRPPDDLELAFARDNLAVTFGRLGDLHGARALQQQALDVLSRTRPADDPDLAIARHNLANTLSDLGETDAARELLETAIQGLEARFPRGHPQMLPTMGAMAVLLCGLGEMEEALVYLEGAWEASQRYAPDDRVGQAVHAGNLGLALWTVGRRDEGLELVRAASATHEELLGSSNARTIFTRATLAWQLALAGQSAEAREETLALARGARARAVELSLQLGPSEVESAIVEDARSSSTVLTIAELLGVRGARARGPGAGRDAALDRLAHGARAGRTGFGPRRPARGPAARERGSGRGRRLGRGWRALGACTAEPR